ncbi:hypothetical protein FW778_17045 [Ginsengibacter hankyongi]|uniref:DUF4352 domain-containing protein n=1 Tax=Ginsengibacter hankyongi TaxID=2607284 RepID=A0A5J5IC85_9BACT|nr:hypothetical protein [Ginsengibacter hankyongi]KAA9037135.1 hypothetical protein FW778_17045 [Ginsengibacter hankyongi]
MTILILGVRIVIKLIGNKPISKTIKIFLVVVLTYIFLWTIFLYKSGLTTNNFGEDVCFDDWCATILSYDKFEKIGDQNSLGQFIVLTIKMTNRARGIDQKPSEPRVHIIDEKGNSWGVSPVGQNAFENLKGYQIPLDQKLELNQSLQTKLVFDIPKTATNLKAVIEEGPFITNLLLQEDKNVFELK